MFGRGTTDRVSSNTPKRHNCARVRVCVCVCGVLCVVLRYLSGGDGTGHVSGANPDLMRRELLAEEAVLVHVHLPQRVAEGQVLLATLGRQLTCTPSSSATKRTEDA